jgi:RNA polymerase sigma-70 factor (ECF subfamily)
MERRREDRDFLSFRRDGSPEALARVFDALAPRLLLLAAHLTRDATEAEDLVQTTFLHAIQGAARYDGARPVAGWLAGILSHRAVDLRRRSAVRDAEPLDEQASAALDPLELASDRELFERITAAIDGLGDPYREVLVLRLVHGLEPNAMAHALGRPPGTVRMQLKRGLEQLRRAMPERAALGALLLDPGRGLADVRAIVLKEASVAGAATATGSIVGGLVMNKALMAAAALAAVGLTIWSVTQGAATAPATPVAAAELPAPPSDPGTPLPVGAEQARDDVGESGPPAREVAASPNAPEAAPPPRFDVLVRFESDGAPAADVSVYVRSTAAAGFGIERRTDAHGRVSFIDLAAGEHEVHVDRLDAPLRADPAAAPSLEVWIPRGLRVVGRVVGLGGEGVADAAVFRFNERHHDLLQAIARTDAKGGFELRDVAADTELVARSSGVQPSEVERVREGGDGRGHVRLQLGADGHRLRGRVLDAAGEPAPYAWVAIGVDEDAREEPGGSTRGADETRRKALDREAFFLRADEHGAFDSDEVPGGHVVVIARPFESVSDQVGWETLWMRPGGQDELVVTLGTGAEMTGVVRDGRGAPVPDVELFLEWEGTPLLGQMEDDLGPWMSDRRARSREDGSYRLAGLLPGDYDLRVVGLREVLLHEERVIAAGAAVVWNPVIETSAPLQVRLVDPDGAPLAGWVIGVTEWEGERVSEAFFAERTDAHGRRTLGQVPADQPIWLSAFAPAPDGSIVRLPAAVRSRVVPTGGELEVRLLPDEMPTCALTGRWLAADGTPLAATTLALERERDGRRTRHSAATEDDGGFAFAALAPGTYHLVAFARDLPRGAPLGAFTLARGEARDVGALSLPEPCRLVLALGGAAGTGTPAEIELTPRTEELGPGDSGRALLGAEWSSDPLLPGEYVLRVTAPGLAPHVEVVRVGPQPETHLSVALERGTEVVLELTVETDAEDWRLRVRDEQGVLVFEERLILTFGRVRERTADFALHLHPGAYRASIWDRTYDSDTPVEVAFEVAREDGQRVPVRLR